MKNTQEINVTTIDKYGTQVQQVSSVISEESSDRAATSYSDDSEKKQVVEDDKKLFVGMLPKTYGESEIRMLFKDYGEIVEIFVITSKNGNSKGCAFVTFSDASKAAKAVKDMHDCIPEDGTKNIVVRFADPPKQGPEAPPRPSEQQILGKLRDKEVEVVGLGAKGGVLNENTTHANLYGHNPHLINLVNGTPYLYTPQQPMMYMTDMHSLPQSSTGDAVVNHGHYPHTYDTLYKYYASNGAVCPSPLCEADSNKYLDMQMRVAPDGTMCYVQSKVIPPLNSHYPDLPTTVGHQMRNYMQQMSPNQRGAEYSRKDHKAGQGPPGCNLFIYHLPREMNDDDLATLFKPFGNVSSAVLLQAHWVTTRLTITRGVFVRLTFH
jgi:RNA recognition motif-containing protein